MPESQALCSVRMRAARGGRHVSGAERVVAAPDVEAVALSLLARARPHGPDRVHLTVERVPTPDVARIPCLPVTTVTAPDASAARAVAERVLEAAGVASAVVQQAFAGLVNGLGPRGAPMRGAALVEAHSGRRLEADPARGVRASHLDYSPEGRAAADQALTAAGLGHFRTLEALAVASKALWAGTLAELCWSDDPDYPAGYVATPAAGYVRFPHFKPAGAAGGRVFFVSLAEAELPAYVERLERRCVLVEPPVRVSGPVSPEAFLAGMEAAS